MERESFTPEQEAWLRELVQKVVGTMIAGSLPMIEKQIFNRLDARERRPIPIHISAGINPDEMEKMRLTIQEIGAESAQERNPKNPSGGQQGDA